MPSATRHPLFELTRARALEFLREPEAIFWVFVFPVVLALVLGIAFRSGGGAVHKAAVTGPGSRPLLERLAPREEDSGVVWSAMNRAQADAEMRAGRLDVILDVGEASGGPPAVTYAFDPSRPGSAEARMAADRAIQVAYGRTDPVPTSQRPVSAKGSRYIDFLLPGLIGLSIMGSCMWGMGYSVVDARRRKLLKRFAVTPMVRSHFLLAFALSRLLLLAAEVGLILVFGVLVFGLEIRGSVLWIAAVALAGTASFSGLALLIASRTESTEAASGWMSFVQFPMWLLSGTFFDSSRFPEFLHPFIRLLPLTALNDSLRAIVNEGAGASALAIPLAILAAWGAVSFAVALRIFRWQ